MQTDDHYGDYFRSLLETYAALPTADVQRLVEDQLYALREQLLEQGYSPADIDQEMAAAVAAAQTSLADSLGASAESTAPNQAAPQGPGDTQFVHPAETESATASLTSAPTVPAFLLQPGVGTANVATGSPQMPPTQAKVQRPSSRGRKDGFGSVAGRQISRSLVWAVLAFVVIYGSVLMAFVQDGHPSLVETGVDIHAVALDVNIVGVDFAQHVMTVSIMPNVTAQDVMIRGRMSQDIALELDTGAALLTHTFKTGEVPVPWPASLPLDTGDPADYPFDQYTGSVTLKRVVEGTPGIAPHITMDKVSHGFRVRARADARSDGHELSVAYGVSRSPMVILVAGLALVGLLLMALSALRVAWMVRVAGRKVEVSMMTWMAAQLFVIPAVRGSLPGAPPLGGLIDVGLVVWLQVLTVVSLLALVVTWSKPQP